MANNTVQDRTLLAGLNRKRGAQGNIQWLDTTVPLGDAGQFTEINLSGSGYTTTIAGNRLTITFTGGGGTGTVTSVAVSGGTTGLTTSGGPITTSGTITLGGTLAIANGGSGQTTANAALNAFLPSQGGNNGKALVTNGTNASWVGVATSPLTTKGDLWGFSTVDARLPVGSNDKPLVADSSASLGVSYKTLPIAGGGTGQTAKTAAYDALSPATTKGDLEAHNGTDVVRLPVGTDGQILRANSAQTTGLEYITSALLPFAPLATEILADSPLNYFKLNETSGNYIDYGSSGNNLTPVGTVVTNYVQAFSRQINSINDKFLRIVTVTSGGGSVSAQPTGLTLNGSWTVCAVYSQRNSSAGIRTFLQVSNSAATSNAVFCGISASNVMNVLMNAGTGGASTNVTAQVVFNPPLGSGTFIYHFTKDSSTRTFSFWCNGIFLGSNTYSAPNEWTGTLTSPKLAVGADQAAQNSAIGLLSNVALFSGVLSETRIIAHAQAAGLYCS